MPLGPLLASAFLLQHPAPELRELAPAPYRPGQGSYEGEGGFLSVPENRSKKEARTIELAFVRLASTAESPGPSVAMRRS